MAQRFDGRVAFITGAGSGIGQAAALRLAQEGATIGVFDLKEESVHATVNKIVAITGNSETAVGLVGDVSSEADVRIAVDKLAHRFGRLDIAFANAGINGVWTPLDELTLEEWNRTIQTNLTGTFLTVKYAANHLKKQGGAIVVTSSVNGTRIFSNTGASAYSTSKAGQLAFSKMVALELAPHKVRINVICPGAIETNIGQNTQQRDTDKVKIPVEFPEGSMPLEGGPGKAEQVAALVAFLVSDEASHITGTEMWIDGAESLLQG